VFCQIGRREDRKEGKRGRREEGKKGRREEGKTVFKSRGRREDRECLKAKEVSLEDKCRDGEICPIR